MKKLILVLSVMLLMGCETIEKENDCEKLNLLTNCIQGLTSISPDINEFSMFDFNQTIQSCILLSGFDIHNTETIVDLSCSTDEDATR